MIRIEVYTVSKYYTFDRKFEFIEGIEMQKLTRSIFRTLTVLLNDHIDLNTDCVAFFYHDQERMPFDEIRAVLELSFSGSYRTNFRHGPDGRLYDSIK